MEKERIVRDIFIDGKYYITKDYIEVKNKKRLSKERFRKVFDSLFKVYSNLTGSEPKVLSWILLNINSQNFVNVTYKQLSKKMNLSKRQIEKIMSKLQKLNVVKNIGGNIYVNPFMYVKQSSLEDDLKLSYMEIFKRRCNDR